MFVRVKKVGPYQYLQIAQNRRQGKRVKQSVIATLGRLDKLTASGAIDQLLRSAARFAERVMVLSEHSRDAHDRPDANVVSIGPALIFERLWRETGCQEVVRKLLATRHHHFDVERAVFMTVLHRLMVSGSDRSALQWRRDQAIDGTAGLELQHLYRAMGWLGEPPCDAQSLACGVRRRRVAGPADHRVDDDDVVAAGHGPGGPRAQHPLVVEELEAEMAFQGDVTVDVSSQGHRTSPIQGCATSRSMGRSVFA